MSALIVFIKSLFSYDHNESIKRFALAELDDINYNIRNLSKRRAQLEEIAFGN